MAETQDVDLEQTLDDGTGDLGELETVQKQDEETKAAESVIPEKYKGKSLEDIIKMHETTEKTLSRQGQELGEVRRLADELLRTQLQSKPKQEKEQEEVDFFANPQEAVSRAIESNPRLIAVETQALNAAKLQARQQISELHPDFQNVIQDEKFVEWVKASPIRLELARRADGYDVAAANELFGTYKTLYPKVETEEAKAEKAARSKAMKSAGVDTGGAGDTGGKKIYSRTALMNLRIKDPAKYEAMYDEILTAYAEGRVKR